MRFLVSIGFVLLLANFINAQAARLDTVFVMKDQSFRITASDAPDDRMLLRVTTNSAIILNDTLEDGLFGIEFPDFNTDSFVDIMLIYGGNNFAYYLYLFDTSANRFTYVEHFNHFPAAIQLKVNPVYYYSYHRAGCSDFNWVSDFFKIENFKAIHLGHIYGKGCDYESNSEPPPVIEVYKVPNGDEDRKTLIQKLPYQKNIPEFGDKWDFIEKY